MTHSIELVDCNIVIVANDFNVTIVNNIWLYKNEIFTEDELKDSINLPVNVEVRADNCIFSVVPNRLQFNVNTKYADAKELILSKIGKLVKKLPHTPFAATGLNFIYHITPQGDDVGSLSKRLFCNNGAMLFDGLEEQQNSRFGGYFSYDLMGARFRLDAKPIKIAKDGGFDEKLQFSYNFNVDLTSEDPVENIIRLIKMWDEAKEYTKNLTEKIELRA